MADNNVLELEKTLKVDGQTYNINAVQADKVAKKLVVNTATFGGSTSSTPLIEYDGSTPNVFEIIPVTGGKFQGPIRVPDADTKNIKGISNTKADNDFMDDAVLNYKDIKKNVLSQLINTSVLYSWTGEVLNPAIDKAIAGISLITGKAEHIDELVKYTGAMPVNYLYICSDTGNIYFGASNSATLQQLGVNSQNISPNAITVGDGGTGLCMTDGKYGLDMANCDMINLNGLFFTDQSDQPNEGLNFVHSFNKTDGISTIKNNPDSLRYDTLYARNGELCFETNRSIKDDLNTAPNKVFHSGMTTPIPVANGGTGQTDLDNVTVGEANQLSTACNIHVNLASTSFASFNGTTDITPGVTGVLPVTNGGTGTTNLNNITVGQASTLGTSYVYKKNNAKTTETKASKITISYEEPSGGNNGDIWIKY